MTNRLRPRNRNRPTEPLPHAADRAVSDGGARPASHTSTGDDPVARLARSAGADPDALRREVSLFRLALDADLTVAAASVDAGAPQIAAEVLDDERREVRGFEQRLLAQVADRPASADRRALTTNRRTRRSRLALGTTRRRTAAVAVAAALVGGAGGAVLAAEHGGDQPALLTGSGSAIPASQLQQAAAQQQLARTQGDALATAARGGLSATQIAAAATAFSTSVGPLLAAARTDPTVARALWQLLVSEQGALRASDTREPAIGAALSVIDGMLRQLQSTVPTAILFGRAPAMTAAPTVSGSASHPSRPTRPASSPPAAAPSTSPTRPSSPSPSAPSPPLLPLPSPSPSPSPSGASAPIHLP